jgi:hypothetical protein
MRRVEWTSLRRGRDRADQTCQFAIWVAGAKRPDACENSGADASVVVSDEAMEGLDSSHHRDHEDASSPTPQ